MRKFVELRIRNADFIECEPYDPAQHGKGIRYPLPAQFVKLIVPRPQIDAPDSPRKSVFVSALLNTRPQFVGPRK